MEQVEAQSPRHTPPPSVCRQRGSATGYGAERECVMSRHVMATDVR